MQPPRIEVIPARPAVCRDASIMLDVLVRITPPLQDIHIVRPPINLGIVLDRSGSMVADQKMDHAREAAIFAVWQLLANDRVSVTVFDDQIETLAPSALATDKADLVSKIRRIGPRGSTALHSGWLAGAEQVLEYVASQALNRVLLLSDGLANVGMTDTGAICAEVRGVAAREVSTSTIGVGRDYNEDLLASMARAGGGSYYFVEGSVQLRDIFQTELQGLMATTGRNVELTVQPGQGTALTEVLTPLDRGPSGQLKLPDLVSEMPVSVLLKMSVGPQPRTREIARFHLAWDPIGESAGHRQDFEVSLALPAMSVADWEKLPLEPAVQEQVVLLMAAKAREELHAALLQGNAATAKTIIDRIREMISGGPATVEMKADLENLVATEEFLQRGMLGTSAKMAHYMWDRRRQGRRSPPPQS
jgi:Ca-activated chloride channel family protein